MQRLLPIAVTVSLLGGLLGLSNEAFADSNEAHASCMGLGSRYYAHFATGQRAAVAHLVKEFFGPMPGEHYREFAQEKEGGSIPSPCGTRIE